MPNCYLVGAGAFVLRDFYPETGDCVIAADNGYSALQAEGIKPDLLVGDFDSLQVIPPGLPRKVFAPEKNDTDMALALAEGIARGYRSFALYGASGGREDHTHANLQLIGGASRQGCDCRMVCPGYDVYTLTNGTLRLPTLKSGTIVSVFCHGDKAEGVTLRGLKYPLTDATLLCDRPLGVSNEATEAQVQITVGSGTLLVYVMQ
jgi:thiamine pyrophosphokinase